MSGSESKAYILLFQIYGAIIKKKYLLFFNGKKSYFLFISGVNIMYIKDIRWFFYILRDFWYFQQDLFSINIIYIYA